VVPASDVKTLVPNCTAAAAAAAEDALAAALLQAATSIGSEPGSGSGGSSSSGGSSGSGNISNSGGVEGNSSGSNSSSGDGNSRSGSSCSLVSLDSVDSYGSGSIASGSALAPLLPALRALSVRDCVISLAQFEHFQCLRQLTSLDLMELKVTERSVDRDADGFMAEDDPAVTSAVSELLQQLPNLAELSLGAGISLDGPALAALSSMHRLQRVALHGANCGRDELAAVPSTSQALLLQGRGQLLAPGALDLWGFEHLTSLELSNVDVEADVISTNWPGLRHLMLDGVGIRLPQLSNRMAPCRGCTVLCSVAACPPCNRYRKGLSSSVLGGVRPRTWPTLCSYLPEEEPVVGCRVEGRTDPLNTGGMVVPPAHVVG
jgi:hypothetical protein